MIYWLTFKIKAHPKYPVTHSFPLALGVYFDKDGDTFDKHEGYTEGPYTNKNKHVIAGLCMPYVKGKDEYHLMISEEQFNASNPRVYIWIEPYGAAALRKIDYAEDNLVGRLELGAKHMYPNKGALRLRPPSSQPDDKQIIFEFEIGDSVAQFMANEMNTNKNSKQANEIRRVLNGTDGGSGSEPSRPYEQRQSEAEWLFAQATHANGANSATAWGQDLYFRGGGEWDHKPIIEPVWGNAWGAHNRLGNSGYVYYYDVWSNLHFGFIAAAVGLPLHRVIAGAGFAQKVDSGTKWEKLSNIADALKRGPHLRSDEEMARFMFADEPEDRRAIMAGYDLYERNRHVTYQMLINIVSRWPESWLVVPKEEK